MTICQERGTKTKSESPTGVKPIYRSGTLTTEQRETFGELGHLLGLYVLGSATSKASHV